MPAIVFSTHAEDALRLRSISKESVEAILASPTWTAPDPHRSGVVRAFGRTPETGPRWVRVAYRNRPNNVIFVITVMPDRNARPPGATP